MRFNYKGFDSRGTAVKGTLHANSEAQAREMLREMTVTAIELKQNKDVPLPWQNRNPGLKDKALFTTLLAQLVGTNAITFADAVNVAARASTNGKLKAAAEDVYKRMSNGEPPEVVFSDPQYAHVFDPVFVAFVLLGTKAGDLGPPLRDLGEMYRWQLHIAALMKKALILPGIILIGVALVSYYITARVVPIFMGILDGLDADLPPLTLAVKAVSELVSRPDFTLLLAGTIVFGVMSFNRYRKTLHGKAAVDRLVLRLPVFGNLIRTFILARFSRSFAVMLRNGVPTVDALLICASVAENEVYRKHIHDMRRNHTQGLPMYPVLLAAEKHFPDAYTQQFKAAEEKSILKSNLQYLGDMLNSEVTNQAEGLASSIEPLIMVLLGGVVGILVLAVFGPMTSMIGALQK